jgi:transposase-like protein
MDSTPKTLIEVITHFADERRAWAYFVARRWPNGVTCPRCNCTEKIHLIESRMKWRCNDCGQQFSAKVGTIFEDSPIGFSKWLPAVWLLSNAKNGISSYELHRALGVTQKTAWFMLQRIRLAMQNGSFELLGGEGKPVEIDETFIGGKSRNMHKSKREVRITGSGVSGKDVVLGFIERGGKVRTMHVPHRTRELMESKVLGNVAQDSTIYSDSWSSYARLRSWYNHEFVDHAVSYVEGQIHTNSMENYWSLLKRTLSGTYVSVEPFHLFRYLDEQAFRYNERKGTDAERFVQAIAGTNNRRVTYAELTGKVNQQTA